LAIPLEGPFVTALLEVQELKKYFPVYRGQILARVTGWVKAVDGVHFSVDEGETFGLVRVRMR
jgi:ABC-type oligopeptide transport system ATPase subunit